MSSKINKVKVGILLEKFGKELMKMDSGLYCDGDGISNAKMNALPQTKKVIKGLKALGVEKSDELRTLGFIPAYMLLKF